MKLSNPYVISISVIILLVIGILLIRPPVPYEIYQGYDRTVDRNFSNSNEEQALKIAENFNYSALFEINGVSGSGRDIWIEYANNQTLAFIDSFAKEYKSNAHITLNYSVWVYEFNQLDIKKINTNFSIISGNIDYATKNASYSDSYSQFFNYNSTTVSLSKENNDFNITYSGTGFIVDMKLKFDNVFGSLGATFSYVRQTLIIDSQYNILNIYFHPTTHIIS